MKRTFEIYLLESRVENKKQTDGMYEEQRKVIQFTERK